MIETWLDPEVVTEKLLNEEIATASAGDAEVIVAVTTSATLAPLAMATRPDESEVIDGLEESVTLTTDDGVTVKTLDGITVGFEESVTVGLEDRVTVPEEIESALLIANDGAEESVTVQIDDGDTTTALDGVTVATEESATVLLVNVTWMADDGMTVGFDERVMVPDEIEIAEESVTVPLLIATAEESVAVTAPVTVGPLDRVTVGAEESVMVPEETVTDGTPVIATCMADDGVIEMTEDGVTESEPAELPQKSPTLTTWRCEVSGC